MARTESGDDLLICDIISNTERTAQMHWCPSACRSRLTDAAISMATVLCTPAGFLLSHMSNKKNISEFIKVPYTQVNDIVKSEPVTSVRWGSTAHGFGHFIQTP